MKGLLIFPPFVSPESGPYLSIPLLIGQLTAQNIDATGLDLNLDFNNEILTKHFLNNTISKLNKIYENIDNEIGKSLDEEAKKQLSVQKELIKTVLIQKKDRTEFVINNIETNVINLKLARKGDFETKRNASMVIEDALRIIALPYFPVFFDRSKLYSLNYYDVKDWAYNSKYNIFIEYFIEKIEEINSNQYNFIGISIPSSNQLPIAFTLARILKENTNVRVLGGGNILYSTKNSIEKYPEIFDLFFDEIMIGEGESALVDYVKYLNGELDISEVSGLMYKTKEGKIQSNPVKSIENVESIADPCYKDLNLKDYFSSSIRLPIQFSKGCYWHKCSFCTAHTGKTFYSIKTPSDSVDMIQRIIDSYGIKLFTILDDAISSKFFEEFADKIIKQKLDIEYSAFLRMEKAYDYKLLKKLYDSGLRRAFWGYEAASERIVKLMNKGIAIKERKKILEDSHKAGIENSVGFIIGFPTETEDEIKMTVEFCKDNLCIIDQIQPFIYELRKTSYIAQNLDKFCIETIKDNEEFSYFYEYNDVVSYETKLKYRQILINMQNQKNLKKYEKADTKYEPIIPFIF